MRITKKTDSFDIVEVFANQLSQLRAAVLTIRQPRSHVNPNATTPNILVRVSFLVNKVCYKGRREVESNSQMRVLSRERSTCLFQEKFGDSLPRNDDFSGDVPWR
jgi:hypothetical protein